MKELREFEEFVVCGDGEVKWKLIRTTHLPTPHTPKPVKTTMPSDVCYLGSTEPSVCLLLTTRRTYYSSFYSYLLSQRSGSAA